MDGEVVSDGDVGGQDRGLVMDLSVICLHGRDLGGDTDLVHVGVYSLDIGRYTVHITVHTIVVHIVHITEDLYIILHIHMIMVNILPDITGD